ncbi:cytochrome P450 [Xylariaceae sp. FL1019]|nr:cytochrome P450 [Xylariaceae sp. FL1019]
MLSDLSTTHLYALIALLPVFSLAYYVIQRARHDYRIRNTGGVRAPSVGTNPFSGARTVIKCAQAQMRNDLLHYFDELFARAPQGSLSCVEVQIKPTQRYIITKEPEQIKAILATQFSDFGKGPLFNYLWRPFLGDSIFTTDKNLWHDSRSLIRPMFIKDRVSDLATFDRWASALIAKLPPSGETVDIMNLLYRMTLDVTTDFLLGASVNSLENPQSEFAHAFGEVQRYQMLITTVGPLNVFIPRGRYKRGIAKIDQFVMPYIQQALSLPPDSLERLSNSDKNFTFLHSITRYTRDPKILRDQIVAVLLAGRDTTAATLSWTFYELCNYPDKYQKLRNEIIKTVGPDGTPTYEDLKNMTYLRHTLEEVLRLYPAVPYNLRSALEDTTIPGAPGQPPIGVAQGDVVVYSTLAMQRRRDLYPDVDENFEDPALFSPERWENWTPKPWQYVPFNGGPRICVGQNFALTEMAYTLVRILQKYSRLEYRGDWGAQQHDAEIVGKPSQGVAVALYE